MVIIIINSENIFRRPLVGPFFCPLVVQQLSATVLSFPCVAYETPLSPLSDHGSFNEELMAEEPPMEDEPIQEEEEPVGGIRFLDWYVYAYNLRRNLLHFTLE